MLPKHALFQLSYTRILVLPTRLERARRCRQEILSLRCLPFHHGSISKLSVQQSTVFPICQYSSTCPSANELVAPPRFELGIKQGLSLSCLPIPPWSHIAGLSRLSAPRRAFWRKKCHDTSLIILTKITIKCLFYFSSSADLHRTHSAAE